MKRMFLGLCVLLCIISSSVTTGHTHGNVMDYPGSDEYGAVITHDEPSLPDDIITELASMYAPVLWFYKESLWEEPFTLIEAEYFIDVSRIVSGNYKLEADGYEGSQILQSRYNGMKNPVYVRVTTDFYDGTTFIVIQYWFHYLYNHGGILSLLNIDHEGEWEMIEVILTYDESILTGSFPEPYLVAYSRHASGEAHYWNNDSIEKEGYHPVAYIAYGTHAAYFEDLGWNEDLNKGLRVGHSDMNFIIIDGREWLTFSGRWGGQENSPSGPMFQESKWITPVLWAVTYLDTYQVHLERPGHVLITNEKGERIGYVGELFVNEMHNAYAVITEDHEYYNLPEGEYAVEIGACEHIGFDVVLNENGKVTHVLYQHELARAIQSITTHISSTMKDDTLHLDEDGDGVIDVLVEPFNIAEYDRATNLAYALILAGFISMIILYEHQRRSMNPLLNSESKMTRSKVILYMLKGAAALLFLLWVFTVKADLLSEHHYETMMLQCSVGLYLLSQVLPAFNRAYTPAQRMQVVLINVGWPFIGIWVVFTLLRWSDLVGFMDIGIDIGYFLAAGILFLVMGYTIKFVRVVRRRTWILFVIGGVLVASWGIANVSSVLSECSNYLLVSGVVSSGVGILVRLKSGSAAAQP